MLVTMMKTIAAFRILHKDVGVFFTLCKVPELVDRVLLSAALNA